MSNDLDRHNEPPVMKLITGGMILVTLVGAFWAAMFPIRGSNDPWWHLKTGEVLWNYFMENGFTFPPHDVFTYTGSEIPWVNHEWLADLIFYFFYSIGGIQGAIVFKALIITVTTALFIWYMQRNGVGWKISCLGTMVMLMASTGTLFLRPPIFTYLGIVIFLHIILSFQTGDKWKLYLAWAVVTEIIWINLHGGAVIGILLVAFWWISDVWFCLITWLKENPTSPSFNRLKTSSIVLGAVSFASLLNPFGYHIHLLPFKVMGDRFLLENIGEMQSPNMQTENPFEIIILGLFLLPMMRAGSIWLYEGLAIVFFGHQALNHTRHIPLFALVAVPPLMSAFAEERETFISPHSKDTTATTIWEKLSNSVRWCLRYHIDILLIFILFSYWFGLRPWKIWDRNIRDFPALVEHGYMPERYPKQAVDFIVRYDLEGPIMNHDNYAGYLIWRLSPDTMKIFTDSRYDLWGSKFAKEELGVYGAREYPLGAIDENGNWRGINPLHVQHRDDLLYFVNSDPDVKAWHESEKPYWLYILDKYDVNFIISVDITGIHYVLSESYKGWVKVYHQGGYVIHVRDVPKNAEIMAKNALNHQEFIENKPAE